MGSFFNQMDRKYKAEWLKALRSGEYQQARGKLYDGTGYCCLGVLCKVAGSKFVITNPDDVRHESDYPVYEPTKLGNDQPGDAESLNDHGLQMFELFKTRFFQPSTGTLCEYLTDELAPQPGPKGDIVEPGHHYEWVWLLRQLQRLAGESVDAYTTALYKHADAHGWDGEGLIVDELSSAGNVITASRRSWPLTEAAKANIAEGERARGTFDEKAAHCFTSLAGRFLQRPILAGWMDRITASGEPMAEFMPASTLYHVFCAITEAARATRAA